MSTKPNIVGYGILGPEEPYLDATLDTLATLCDTVIICGNNATQADEVKKRGFHYVEDNREWGKLQWKIKEDFVKNHVAKLKPDLCVCMDMDEVFDHSLTKEKLYELYQSPFEAYYFRIINLWDDGYAPDRSFWNIRAWKFLPQYGLEWPHKNLHCGLAPEWTWARAYYTPHLLIHYGLKDKKRREQKVKRYDTYDPKARFMAPEYYESLRKGTRVLPYNEEALLDEVVQYVHDIKQKHYHRPMANKEEIAYVRTKHHGVIAVPKAKLQDYLRQGHEFVGESESIEKTINAVLHDEPFEKDEVFRCGQCGREFDSKRGLRGHTMGAHQNQHIKKEETKSRWSWNK